MKQLPIIERAAAHAGRTAFRTEAGRHSYADLLARSGAMAAELLDGRGDLAEGRVAYLLPAGLDHAAAQWGIWRAGGVAVPLSLSAAEPELGYTLGDAQAGCVVTTRELAGRVTPLCKRLGLRAVLAEDVAGREPPPLPEVTADRRALIVYTSGSTGPPKGVVTTHAAIRAQVESLVLAWRWQADDCIPLFLPLHHVHGIINVMTCALWSGAAVEPFPRFDREAVLGRVAAGAYTVFMAVPTIYVLLIEALEGMPAEERGRACRGFAAMRLMVSGSAALPAAVHRRWADLTGQQLLERYGMTEIGMALSNPYDGERRPGSVGLPLPGVEVRLAAEDGGPAGDGPGEIQVRGATVFAEYWGRPGATAEAFRDGWFRTGDVAAVEGGYYRILGRSSVDIIKSGGYKLSALEIEAVLLDHPAVRDCAVVGVPDATYGEAVAAAVVLHAGGCLDLDALRSWCAGRMSAYKAPRRLLVVGELPRNAMNKVLKPAVRELFG